MIESKARPLPFTFEAGERHIPRIDHMCGICQTAHRMTQRMVLEVTPAQRRQVKILAACSGMSVKDFILSRVFSPEEKSAARKGKPSVKSETGYLLASKAMEKRIMSALREPPNKRRAFKSVKDLKNALGA